MKRRFLQAAMSAAMAVVFILTAFRREWLLRPVHPSSIYRMYMPKLFMVWLACIAVGLAIAFVADMRKGEKK